MASQPASAQQPSQPNHTRIRPAHARGPACGPASPTRPQLASSRCHLGPARQPRAAHPRASLSFARSHCHAGPARQRPHPQCHLLHANASTAHRPNTDSGDRGGLGRGHARGMTLSPCAAPTQPLATVRCKLVLRSPLIPIRRSSMPWPKLRLQKPRPGALALVPLPAATSVAIHCAPEPRERREKGRKSGKRRSCCRRGDRRSREQRRRLHHRRRSAQHNFRSFTASNRHGTAIHSPTPPKVSLPVSLAAGPCYSAMALHAWSA